MKIAVLKETRPGEKRVAATPESVKKFIKLGFDVEVEKGAGESSYFSDQMFEDAGAKVATRSAALKSADLVLGVQGQDAQSLSGVSKGAAVIATMNPYQQGDLMKAYADAGLTAMAMEFMPRITRAQSMDVLSSQSNLSGYKAVLDACEVFGRAFPMMMTAAGTIPAARVFVMGAGVAGLQAVATARRLGAIVSATDVRAATKEQVESLGGKFIFLDELAQDDSAGGYARELTDEQKAAQAALIASHVPKQDIVITTALIPGRAAPRLVTADMVAGMKAGSVLVDLAVEQGGNVEGSKPGDVVETANGVKIVGHINVPSRLAADASSLYARNLYNYISAFVSDETKTLAWDFEDDILKGVVITRDGKIVHPALQAG